MEENLEVDEVNVTNSSLEEEEKSGRKKSYKDIIWQWDDAAWIMCAVLMTFTMQVSLLEWVVLIVIVLPESCVMAFTMKVGEGGGDTGDDVGCWRR